MREWDVRHGKRHWHSLRRFGGANQRCRGYLHVDTREWFYVSAYLQYRLYCFGHEFVFGGHFDCRDVRWQSLRRFGGTNQRCRGYLHVDTREWFYVSAYLQYRLYCFGHEFVYFGRFDRRDVFG